jgi:His/Glu/Gln/Arg/opine family amino acid ABC transporter permease subunit
MDFQIVIDKLPLLGQAAVNTIVIFVVTLVLGTILGLIVAGFRFFGPRWLARILEGYSWFLRSIPALLVLFYVFYGLPKLGIFLSSMQAAILGLTIATSAYMSETFRSGLLAIRRDQFDAARSLGLPFGHIIRRIVAPQAAAIVLPPYTSNVVLLLKGTSLASVVAVAEMTGVAYSLISTTYRPFQFLAVVAAFYLVLGTILIVGLQRVERRVAGTWRKSAGR